MKNLTGQKSSLTHDVLSNRLKVLKFKIYEIQIKS